MTYPPIPPGIPQPGHGPMDPTTAALAIERRRSSRRLTIILAATVVVLAMILAVAANQVFFAKTGKSLIPGLTLRAANDAGPDPFTQPVTLVNRAQPVRPAVQSAPGNGVRLVNGTTPGFYGTTGTAACDTASLGNQLAADPAAARAWASVQGIRTVDIPWYLNSLSPVVLTADTWVTNHAYRGGGASPFQAVLQAGTAVFVDAAGVPRVVCACGNPLRPPAAAPIGGYRVTGDPWPDYTVNNIHRVTYNNTYVTNNTTVEATPEQTTVVAPTLTLTDLNVNQLVDQVVGDTIVLPDTPPPGLPDFRSQALQNNAAPSFESDEAAQEQGLAGAGDTAAAPAVTERAESNGNNPENTPVDPNTPTSGAPDTAPTDAPMTDAADTPGAPATPYAPAATVFDGSGDAIGSLTYREADGREVTCELPAQFEGTAVTPTNSDCALMFSPDDLLSAQVNAAVAADGNRVWKLTPVGRTQSIEVLRAQWQTLAAPSTPETPTTETPTTETPTTESPTTETSEPSTSTSETAPTSGAVPSS